MTAGVLIAIAVLLGSGSETRTVEQSEIMQLVEHYVQDRLASLQQEVRVEFRSVPIRLVNIPRDAHLQVADVPASQLRGSVTVPVEVLHRGRVQHTFLVSLRVRTYGRVLVAGARVDKQTRGDEMPVLVEERETTSLPDDILTTRDVLSHLRTRQIIQRGAILRTGMFEHIPTIHQGSVVTVIVQAGAVTVRTQAVAREDGHNGDRVRVQKLGSHEILTARVIDEQTVELLQE